MKTRGAVMVRVPVPRRDIAKQFQTEYREQYNIELPLWRCLILAEQREQSKNDPFRHLKRRVRL